MADELVLPCISCGRADDGGAVHVADRLMAEADTEHRRASVGEGWDARRTGCRRLLAVPVLATAAPHRGAESSASSTRQRVVAVARSAPHRARPGTERGCRRSCRSCRGRGLGSRRTALPGRPPSCRASSSSRLASLVAPPKRKTGGRVTPKGTKPGQLPTAGSTPPAAAPRPGHRRRQVARARSQSVASSSRYTPPIPKSVKESPKWVPILMLVLLVDRRGLHPGSLPVRRQRRQLAGVRRASAFVLGGLYTATKWH